MIGAIARGAVAGVLATVPMSLVMVALQRALPGRREPLPPREITESLLEAADVDGNESATRALTVAGHFGYGAACGALFAPIARGVPAGVMFGLLVWTVSYFGLLPALQLFPPASDKPARQNALMIGAHIVWGGVLGALSRYLRVRSAAGTSS
jgi:putative membrane protein